MSSRPLEPTLSYNIEEIIFAVDKSAGGNMLKQNICRIVVPETGSSKIEEFVVSKGLNTIPNLPGEIDWGYVGGSPLLYIEVASRLTGEDLNRIELAIREKGIRTFGGGLST